MGIDVSASQRAPLSEFSEDKWLLWMECRQTTLKVDKMYDC
jgi:hypothetical protein